MLPAPKKSILHQTTQIPILTYLYTAFILVFITAGIVQICMQDVYSRFIAYPMQIFAGAVLFFPGIVCLLVGLFLQLQFRQKNRMFSLGLLIMTGCFSFAYSGCPDLSGGYLAGAYAALAALAAILYIPRKHFPFLTLFWNIAAVICIVCSLTGCKPLGILLELLVVILNLLGYPKSEKPSRSPNSHFSRITVNGFLLLHLIGLLPLGSLSSYILMLSLIWLYLPGFTDTLLHFDRIAETVNAQRAELLSLDAMRTLASNVDDLEQNNSGHSARVAAYSMSLASQVGWSDEQTRQLGLAALMHDIGKIGVPESILNKPGKLTETEIDVLKRHTTSGFEILSNLTTAPDADIVALHHHERYDGNGYPNGLRGGEIPLACRIVSIADAFDDMHRDRSYRKALSPEQIRQELVDGKGTQFDPHLVDLFLELHDQNALEIPSEYSDNNTAHEDSMKVLQRFLHTATDQSRDDSHDILTGLLNRENGERKIIEIMSYSGGCLIFLDLDNLKSLNDIYGHTAGDRALQTLGKILLDIPKPRIACRLGGDEFLIFLPEADKAMAEKTIRNVIQTFNLVKEQYLGFSVSSISAGMCISHPQDLYPEIYSNADRALYTVKQGGKNGYAFYDSHMDHDLDSAENLSSLLRSIQTSLNYTGAMNVEYREFSRILGYIHHIQNRYHLSFFLSIISLVPLKEKVTQEEGEAAMKALGDSIHRMIRNVDVCTRYSRKQFLLIITGSDTAHLPIIIGRIRKDFYNTISEKDFKVSYNLTSFENMNIYENS